MNEELRKELSYEENAKIVDARKAAQAEAKNKADYEDLKKKIEISIRTTMIGNLSDIEDHFGYLWGIDKGRTLSENEKAMREEYLRLRESILDRGNGAIEKALYHLSRFEVTAKIPSYKKFTIGTKNEEN